jgi:hypothetical protein
MPAQKYQDRLESIKKNVEQSREFSRRNIERWCEFRRFLFKSALDERDLNVLEITGKPALEFNILNAYVSRLRGEFSKQRPSIKVGMNARAEAMQDVQSMQIQQQMQQQPPTADLIRIVEGYIRYMEDQAAKRGVRDRVYTDLLSGGFSAFKVWTDYKNPSTFEQEIKFGRAYDPTMIGFDPVAQLSHKADGRYCHELFPKSADEFKQEHPKVDLSKIKFNRKWNGFNWSYRSQKEDILLIAQYYEKKKKDTRIVQLSDGTVIQSDKYEEFSNLYSEKFPFRQIPRIVDERSTIMETIVRYKCVENQVLEYKEMDFRHFPLIYVSGDAVILRNTANGEIEEFTRPYIYDAKGVQKLKNFAGQTLANELENMIQHKWKVPKEGIPDEYADAYVDNQIPNVLIYNQFLPNNPEVRIDPPQEVQRIPTPPEVINTFNNTDSVSQTILGSYDASLGINNNQLSGVAIVEGATQSNAAAMPFIVGFMQGFNQVAQVILDLIPKYITSKSVPILTDDNKKLDIDVNQEGASSLNYNPEFLNIEVEAGVNFKIQQNRTIQQITGLMQASPMFSQIMGTQGLPVLVDNLDIRGKDKLKEIIENALQQAQNQPQQPNPEMINAQIKQQQLEQDAQNNQNRNAIDAGKVAVMKQEADTDRMRLMAEIRDGDQQRAVQQERDQTEQIGQAVNLAIKAGDSAHKQNKELAELHQKLSPPTLSKQLEE